MTVSTQLSPWSGHGDTATLLNLESAMPLQILQRRFTDRFLYVQCPWLLCFTPCLSCAVALLRIDCRPSFDRSRYLRRRPWCLQTVVKSVLENCARIPYLRVPTVSRFGYISKPSFRLICHMSSPPLILKFLC